MKIHRGDIFRIVNIMVSAEKYLRGKTMKIYNKIKLSRG